MKFNPENFNPEETVGSFAHKIAVEEKMKAKKSLDKYKPTPEEEAIIKEIIAPLLNKIEVLQKELMVMPEGEERDMFEKALVLLVEKILEIRIPQALSKEEIKNLIFIADTEKDIVESDMPEDFMDRIRFLEKKIDFFLDQLSKRLK